MGNIKKEMTQLFVASAITALGQSAADGGDWGSLPTYRHVVAGSYINEIEFCRAGAGWLEHLAFTWANGQKRSVGNRTADCHTIKLAEGDCITKIDSHAGGYVEEFSFDTKFGSWGTVGKWDKVPSPVMSTNFHDQCLTGVYGRTNGAIVKQGYIFDTQPCETISAVEHFDIPGNDQWMRNMSQEEAEKLLPSILKDPMLMAVYGEGHLWLKKKVHGQSLIHAPKRTIYMCTQPIGQ